MAAPFRADDPHGFLRAVGDFNGDGEVDAALVLIAEARGPSGRPVAIGTFAFLSQPGGGWRLQPVRILEHPLPVDFVQFGIVARRPGRYVTACGAGYGDGCAPGEPASVDLEHAGLVCGLLESVAGIYWWNSETESFDGVPVSD
ncbi:MAG: hypothetical protein JSU82_05785 [Rhodospirillales bacterium]|nr:MAG: hypothetical protein JSU82_05785 [Rhodospirillales bacterium]